MTEILVSIPTLRSGAEILMELNTHFKFLVNEMSGTETALKSMWEGDGNNAFHSAFMTDKGKMDLFAELIDKYIDALRKIADNYIDMEQAVTGIATERTYH